MAILNNFVKQPVEFLDYDIDYASWLTPGDNLQPAGSVVEVTGDDAALTANPISVAGTRVKVWLTGGTAGASYKVTVTTTTADGRIKQDEFRVRVKDF